MADDSDLFQLIMAAGGQEYEAYVAGLGQAEPRMREMLTSARRNVSDLSAFEEAVSRHGGTIHACLISEVWCSDTMGALPLLAVITDAIPGFQLSVLQGSRHPDINDRLQAEGMDRVPKLLFFSAEGKELGRFMERGKAVQKLFDLLFAELGDPEPYLESDDPAEQQKGMAILQKMGPRIFEAYEHGLWTETAAEWAALLGIAET